MARFYEENYFTPYMQHAIAQRLQSVNRTISVDKVFTVLVGIGIEPVDIRDFGPLKTSTEFVEHGDCPIGMLQVLDVLVNPDPPESITANPEYDRMRNYFGKAGFPDIPIVKAELVHYKADAQGKIFSYVNIKPTPFGSCLSSSMRPPAALNIPNISGNGHIRKQTTADTCLE